MIYCNDMPPRRGRDPARWRAQCLRRNRHGVGGVGLARSSGEAYGALSMWRLFIDMGGRMVRRLALILLAAGLTGCASTIAARVTSFQQWPQDTMGATYRIVATPDQQNNLEFQNYADMVRAAIGPVGLVEAGGNVSARFDVHIEYGNPVEKRWVQRYNDPYWDGWGFNPFFGGVYSGYRGWGWGSGIYVTPSVVTVPIEVYKNTLTITIIDNQNNGAEVYRSTALNMSDADNLALVMPYLAQAVFDGFPGNNGQVREVRYRVGK